MENEIQLLSRFSFSRRNWKINCLNRSRLTLWLFSQVLSTRYLKASLCQVSWNFLLNSVLANIKNPPFRKQLICFNVYITGCYFDIKFYFKVNRDIKHTSRSSHHDALLKPLVKLNLKFKKNLGKIIVKDFILCLDGSTIPIIWNTFSCLKRLFPLCRTYPR